MRTLTAVLTSAAVLAGCGGGEPAQAERFGLDNGLTVLVRPVAGTEEVALVVLYGVGGLHDGPGRSGLAHLLEHCYATAAAGPTPARDIQQYMARYPNRWNAQTGDDYTVLACVFPRERLDEELADAAARMGDLRITPADLDRERLRLAAELANMFGRMPPLAARNLAREHVCPSPDGGRKGGVEAQVSALTAETVQQHWQRYYKPRNAVLVLAGGVEPAAARAAVARHFGPLPAGEAPPAPAPRPSAALPVARTVAVQAALPGAGPSACLAWAAPEPGGDLYPAFLVLVARLWARAQTLAKQPGEFPVQYAPLDDPAVLTLAAPPAPGETAEQTASRLQAFVADACKADLSPADRTAAMQAFGFLLGLADLPDAALAQNLYGVAFSLGRRAQLGLDPAALKKALDGLRAADLRRAADRVFAKEAAAAVVVRP